jgi:hypothetical protein
MVDDSNIGSQINGWRAEWEASEELQFQFRNWTAYALGRRLRQVWEGSAQLQSRYGEDFRAFCTAAKKMASDQLCAEREKAKRAGGRVAGFIGRLLSKN